MRNLDDTSTPVPHARMKTTVRNICVYCGSGPGHNPAYADSARILGQSMAEAGVGLVYGGGSLGLMGEIARSVLKHGGHVTGIIPEFLSKREKMLRDVQELIVTHSMHERKQIMFDKSDAFVALPGGLGTLEELVEQLTWSQLGQHTKPIVLGDIDGFWTPLLSLVEHMRSEAFIREGLEVNLTRVSKAAEIVPTIQDLVAKAGEPREGLEAVPDKF